MLSRRKVGGEGGCEEQRVEAVGSINSQRDLFAGSHVTVKSTWALGYAGAADFEMDLDVSRTRRLQHVGNPPDALSGRLPDKVAPAPDMAPDKVSLVPIR